MIMNFKNIIQKSREKLYFIIGLIFLILAMVGVIVPLLPTTPFVLVAIYFFDRSSKQFRAWCEKIPGIGQGVVEWKKHKVIRLRAKIQASVVLSLSAGMIYFDSKLEMSIKILVLSVLGLILTFLVSRPSKP